MMGTMCTLWCIIEKPELRLVYVRYLQNDCLPAGHKAIREVEREVG